MEIELKYKVPSPEIADKMWKNRMFCHMEEDDSREEIYILARYFDTDDLDLYESGIMYRIRCEGCKMVATLKWQGSNEGALHERQEINIPVCDEKPDPSIFKESEIGRKLPELIGDKQVSGMMESRFHRRRLRIDTGKAIFELSIDDGAVVTPYGEEPIAEAELELFSGEQEELERIGEKMREKYGLEEETRSKYARGLELIKKNRDDRSC